MKKFLICFISLFLFSMTNLFSQLWQENGTKIYYNTDNVGIGISNPSQILHVNGTIRSDGGLLLNQGSRNIDNMIYVGSESAGSVDASFGFFVAGKGSGSISQGPFMIARGNDFSNIEGEKGCFFFGAGKILNPTGTQGSISFFTNDGTSHKSIILSNGDFGIGTTSPTEKLHVVGNIIATGNIRANGNTYVDGILAIGTTSPEPTSKLHVAGNAIVDGTLYTNGKIWSEEVEVVSSVTWPDYVFHNNYSLMSIPELEQYINDNGHLPEIPKAEEAEQGIKLGEMNTKLLKKIEELTLYMIQQQKEIDELKELIKNK